MFAGGADMHHLFLHTFSGNDGRFVFKQLRETQNGIERCAQLMAHAGHEYGLGVAGEFGDLLGSAQLFGFLAPGRIQHQRQQHRMAFEYRQLQVNLYRINAAVGTAVHRLKNHHLFLMAYQQLNRAVQRGFRQFGFDIEGAHGAQGVHRVTQIAQRPVVCIVEAQRLEIHQINLGQAAFDDAGKAIALFAGTDALGNVRAGTDHAQRLAPLATRHHLAANKNPFPAAVLAAYPVLALASGGSAVETGLQPGQHLRSVVGMDAVVPAAVGRFDFSLRIAEHVQPTTGNILLTSLHIEIPHGVLRTVKSKLPALLTDAQLIQRMRQRCRIGSNAAAQDMVPDNQHQRHHKQGQHHIARVARVRLPPDIRRCKR